MSTVVVTSETFTESGVMVATVALQSAGDYFVTHLGVDAGVLFPDYDSAVIEAEAWALLVSEQVDSNDKITLVKAVEAKQRTIDQKDREIAELQDQIAKLSEAALVGPVDPGSEVKG